MTLGSLFDGNYLITDDGDALPCAYDVLRRIAEEVNGNVQCETI